MNFFSMRETEETHGERRTPVLFLSSASRREGLHFLWKGSESNKGYEGKKKVCRQPPWGNADITGLSGATTTKKKKKVLLLAYAFAWREGEKKRERRGA